MDWMKYDQQSQSPVGYKLLHYVLQENYTNFDVVGDACTRLGYELYTTTDVWQEIRMQFMRTKSKPYMKDWIDISNHASAFIDFQNQAKHRQEIERRIISKIKKEVAASAGAACHSDKIEISHVLKAMRVPEEWARGTLRFSTGRMTNAEEIDHASEIITNTVQQLLET